MATKHAVELAPARAAVPEPLLERLAPQPEPEQPESPEQLESPRRRTWLRLTVLVIACCTVGATIGGGLAYADHLAVQRQEALVPLLAEGAVAVQQVDSAGQRLDPPRLIDLLTRVQAAQAAVERVTTGRSWMVATATTRRSSSREISGRADGLALLAAAAGPLKQSLTTLRDPGASDPDQLENLARDLNRFASVSLRAQQLGTYPAPANDAGTPFEQLATAAAVLPTMAGSETRRYWVACATPSSSYCARFAVEGGRMTGRAAVVRRSVGTGRSADITVIGRRGRDLVVQGRLSVQNVLTTLVATDSTAAGADDSAPVVTSVVPVEQHALSVIARHGTS